MRKVFKVCILFLVMGLMLAVTACGPFKGFDDDDAILKTTSHRLIGASQNPSIITSKYELTASSFNGVIRIRDIEVSENPVFKMDLIINSGRFKVVLVKDSEIFLVTSKDVQESVKVDNLPAGTYNLRIVGCDANIEFVFHF